METCHHELRRFDLKAPETRFINSIATIMKTLQPTAEYIHYGGSWAGPAPAEFINFDASPTLLFERIPVVGRLYTKNAARFPINVAYGDITKGLPLEPGKAKGVYCSHVLEHLALDDCRAALANTRNLLSSGGLFRFVLPDLRFLVNRYHGGHISSLEFISETGLGSLRRPRGFRGLLEGVLGNSTHLWMWDEEAMMIELINAGFSQSRRAHYGDSKDPMFKLVEDKGRWQDCLGFECTK
jgi:SAM-dependent methyltransferase